jgi:putative ABC transport system ATP-binding protein
MEVSYKYMEGVHRMDSFIELKNVKKSYDMGEVVIKAVDDVSFSIDKGEFVIILGASGAGKSTILNLLGGMDQVTDGSIYVDGNEISKYDKKMLTKYRREDIGFVFQFYNLVQNLNAVENVELAVEICKNPMDPVEVLKNVGLEERLQNFPSQLSGGEQQRVSIARAIAKNPKLLLCDEPTGALDYNTGKAILKLLADTQKMYNMTVIVITHNSAIAPIADKIITVKNGKVKSVQKNLNPVSIESIEW